MTYDEKREAIAMLLAQRMWSMNYSTVNVTWYSLTDEQKKLMSTFELSTADKIIRLVEDAAD